MNFDAKPRRTSWQAEDLFYSHIVGMDSFAAGLRVAAAMKEDGFLDDVLKTRYASWDEGLGKDIEDGKEDFKSLEEKLLDTPQAELRAATQSDHLEQIKDTINHYIIQTLAK
ncbi:MAG: Xylose isomerase [Limosilactobacillus fermentum]